MQVSRGLLVDLHFLVDAYLVVCYLAKNESEP